jgi:16S rRNA U1498 N3-methylase RsmE
MALLNRATQIAASLPKVFKALREGTAPDKFNQQYLVDLGFGNSNYRILIPLLKDLGFLSADGIPTERYLNYLDSSRSKKVLGEAVKQSYSDIFTITKSSFNLSDLQAERNANTCLALAELSDFSEASAPAAKPSVQEGANSDGDSKKDELIRSGRVIGSRYDIAIHLPASKDIEVYNAIFKSLKDHLVD